jgi:hypothetical protein
MLRQLGHTGGRAIPSWLQHDHGWSLSFDDHDTKRVLTTDITSGATTTVLSPPDGTVDALAWLPITAQLATAIGKLSAWFGLLNHILTVPHIRLYADIMKAFRHRE